MEMKVLTATYLGGRGNKICNPSLWFYLLSMLSFLDLCHLGLVSSPVIIWNLCQVPIVTAQEAASGGSNF